MQQPAGDPNVSTSKQVAIAIEQDHGFPWHEDCYQGIVRYGKQQGWTCIVDPYLSGNASEAGPQRYDGVVGRISPAIAQVADQLGIPVVNHWLNTPARGLANIFTNEREGARLGGEHLVDRGYQRFVYIGGINDVLADKEIQGLTEAVTAKGFMDPEVMLIPRQFEAERDSYLLFQEQIGRFLDRAKPPVGVFAHSTSAAARYLAQACQQRGLRVPGDIGIVVQPDMVSITESAVPTLTAIEHDYIKVGYEAAALLDRLMKGKDGGTKTRYVAPTRLIMRDSTDVFLCEDPMVKKAMQYIGEHVRESLKVSDVADGLGTSQSTLRRNFEKVLGKQAKDEIARVRVERIKVLLVESDLTLAQIADDFGFSSPGQFTRFFGSVEGETPSAYRKRFQG